MKIKKLKIKHLSLCKSGKNGFSVVYKSDSTDHNAINSEMISDIHFDEEEGTITVPVYVPEVRDMDGHYATASEIKKAVHEFSKNGEGVDVIHDGNTLTKDMAYVAENFVIQEGDPRFQDLTDLDGNKVSPAGGWGAVIKIEDPELRELYKSGEWTGVSMGGMAAFDRSLAGKVTQVAKAVFSRQGESDMKPEEVEALLDKRLGDLEKAVSTLADAREDRVGIEKSETQEIEAPVFKGDMSDKAARRDHRKALRVWEAHREHSGDPSKLFEALADLEDEYTAEIAKAKEEETDNSSNQTGEEIVTLTKADQETEEIMKSMLSIINRDR